MNEKELIEPYALDEENFILGVNQNQVDFPNPKFTYQITEKGFKTEKKLATNEEIVGHYWAKRTKKIALLGTISALIPFSILTQESGIFDMIFGKLTEGISWVIGTLWGMVF